MTFESALRAAFPDGDLRFQESMSRHTTFRAGGCARALLMVENTRMLQDALRLAREYGVNALVIGNGSNLLVRDGGLDALVLKMAASFSHAEREGALLRAEAGIGLGKLAAFALENALTGLEFASGIPGTLGGGAAMNAGAYDGQLSDVIQSVEALDPETLECRSYENEELDYGYRRSLILEKKLIVTGAVLRLAPGDPERIRGRMNELNARRREKQPLEFASAGSTFKRPQGYFAGALIEGAGLKGLCVGDAQVSEKHAGFIINRGNASASQILELIELVRAGVLASSGVLLEPEVRILGKEA